MIDKITGADLDKYLLRKYKISLAEYERIGEQQGWRCAVCGWQGERRLVVDHCHKSKSVRGLLCQHCNLALGHFRDSVPAMRAAIEYLQYNS